MTNLDPNSRIVAPPETTGVVSTGQVPKGVYTAVFVEGKLSRSKSSDYRQIEAKAEIVAPDVVDLPDGRKSSVAAKKFDLYMTVDPTAKKYDEWYQAFTRLGLRDEQGNLDINAIIDAMKARKVFFLVVLDSEEQVQRYAPAPGKQLGEPIMNPLTGKPLTSGWRCTYVQPTAIIGATSPDGVTQEAVASRPF